MQSHMKVIKVCVNKTKQWNKKAVSLCSSYHSLRNKTSILALFTTPSSVQKPLHVHFLCLQCIFEVVIIQFPHAVVTVD